MQKTPWFRRIVGTLSNLGMLAGLTAGLLILLLAGAQSAHAQTQPPTAPECTAPAQVQLVSSQELYQDYDDKPEALTNMYVQFQITNTTASTIESVRFGITDTTYITPATHEDSYVDVHLAPGESTFVYYYLKTFQVPGGQGSSVTGQPLWLSQQTGDKGAGTALCKTTQMFSVHDVEKNDSNKIDSVTAGDLGDGCMNMFVNGRTGNASAPMFFAVTPAALDDWPADLLNLVSMTATVQTSPPAHFTNTLLLNDLPTPNGTGWPYTVAYKFCVVDLNRHETVPPLRVRPVSYINTSADISQSPFDPAKSSVSIPLPLGDKTDGGVTGTAGSTVVYVVTVSNIGTVPSPNVVITDTVPDNTVFAAAGSSAWTGCVDGSPAGTECHIHVGTVYPTSTITYTFAVVVDQALPASINVVTNTLVGNPSSILDDDFTPIVRQAQVGITKSDGLSAVLPGDVVTYTIVVTNAGPSALMGATISDVPPVTLLNPAWQSTASNATRVPGSGSGDINATVSISSGGRITYTLSGTVAASATGMLANTATVIPPAGITLSNSITEATDIDSVVLAADLSIIKTASPMPSVVAGKMLTYTLVVANAGPSDMAGALINDALPVTLMNAQRTCVASAGADCGNADGAGSLSNVTVSLDARTVLTITLVGTVDPAATGSIANTATVTVPAGAVDTDGSNNSSTVNTQASQVTGLSIDKQGPAIAVPGLQLIYTIIVTNNGPSVATNVTVSDAVPAGLTFFSGSDCTVIDNVLRCIAGTLSVNASKTFVVVFDIAPAATGSVSNTAGVTSTQNIIGVDDTVVTVLTPLADFDIEKRAPATAMAGEQLTYTLIVTNNGPSVAHNVTVSDAVPAGLILVYAPPQCGVTDGVLMCVAGTLPVHVSGSFDVTFMVGADVRGVITNTATVTSTEMPTETTTTVTTTINAVTTLVIEKIGPAWAVPGTPLTYSIVVTNNGPSKATDVTITDPDPANLTAVNSPCANGVCNVGSLNVGASYTLLLTYNIDPFAAGSVTNTASMTSAESPAPVTATATTQLQSWADLSISKTDGLVTAAFGTPITYTIVVMNNGPSGVDGALVHDALPMLLHIQGWGCEAVLPDTCVPTYTNSSVNAIDAQLKIAPNRTVTITVEGLLTTSAQERQLINTATVTVPASVMDGALDNNSSTDTTALVVVVDVSVTKTVTPDNVITPETVFTYVLSIGNAGPSTSEGVWVSDILPDDMINPAWMCEAAAGSSCGAVNGYGNINQLITIVPGSQVTYTLFGVAASHSAKEIYNTATVMAGQDATDTDLSNNSDTVTETISLNAFVAIDKNDDQTIAVPGSTITYVITLRNDGPSDVFGRVHDVMPAELSGVQVLWESFNGAALIGDPNDLLLAAGIMVTLPDHSMLTMTVPADVNLSASGILTNIAEYAMADQFVATNPTTRAVDVDVIVQAIEMGKVFIDVNGNAMLDAGEPPLPNIKVMLTCAGHAGVEVTTDVIGDFSLVVPPVMCDMAVVPSSVPAGYRLTTNNDHQTNIALAGMNMMQAIGYQGMGSLSGVTFNDVNANQIRDEGEAAISNVMVTLAPSEMQPAMLLAVITTTSDANGSYAFTNVAAGAYVLNAIVPAGFVNTTLLLQNAAVRVNMNTTIDLGFQNPGVLTITKDAQASGVNNQLGTDRLINYTLIVTNNGGGLLNNVLVTDTLAPYLQYVAGSATPTPVTTSPLVWQLGDMLPGASVKIQFVVMVLSSHVGASSNVAFADSDQTPPVPSNEAVVYPTPTAISIAWFTAQREPEGVRVAWQTGFERNTAGFNLLRSATGSRVDAVVVNLMMIASGEKGGQYAFVDASAEAGVTYTYWLQEIELDGKVNDYPDTAVAQGSTGQGVTTYRVFMPMILK